MLDSLQIAAKTDATAKPGAAPAKQTRAEAEKVASQFEAMFVQQIVAQMRESASLLGDSSMFGEGPGADTYAGWFDTFMSEHLAESGQVGVTEALMRQFDELGQLDSGTEKVDAARRATTSDRHLTTVNQFA